MQSSTIHCYARHVCSCRGFFRAPSAVHRYHIHAFMHILLRSHTSGCHTVNPMVGLQPIAYFCSNLPRLRMGSHCSPILMTSGAPLQHNPPLLIPTPSSRIIKSFCEILFHRGFWAQVPVVEGIAGRATVIDFLQSSNLNHSTISVGVCCTRTELPKHEKQASPVGPC